MNIARRVALLAFVCMFFTLIAVGAAAAHWRAIAAWSMVVVFLSALCLIGVAVFADRHWRTKVKCEHCKHETPWDWRHQIIEEFE